MITDHHQAADEMADLFRVPWTALGYAVEWPNLLFTKPGITATWARWTLDHATGAQSSLAGTNGRARYSKGGFIVVETFTPLGAGVKVAYDAAQVAINAYEGKRTPSDVWFRNVRIGDDGPGQGGDKAWWSTVVFADFVYDNFN